MWSTSASAAATSARRWWCARCEAFAHPRLADALRLERRRRTTSRRCCAGSSRSRRCSSSPARPSPRRRRWPTRTRRKDWFLSEGGQDIARHFVAATTNVEAAAAFGIETTFGFWDWVGGRYSLWSAIGLPIAIAIGSEHFRELLAGAHAMDRHFATAPLARNLPVLLGLIDVWYRNFHRFASRCVAPYHQGLARLPAYLQQLEMESNGKCVDLDGEALPFATSPVVWGEPGTNGQHAFFQMLHQGTDVIPVEFILVKQPTHGLAEMHRLLLANGLAQAQALMQGKTAAEALQEKAPTASDRIDPAVLARHRSFPGNRPSTTLLLDQLTPRSLGALIALYEHRVFTSGALWQINSFDQWGVELGKALCKELVPRFASGDRHGLDASTAGLLDAAARLMARTLVFDLGGVVLRWQPASCCSSNCRSGCPTRPPRARAGRPLLRIVPPRQRLGRVRSRRARHRPRWRHGSPRASDWTRPRCCA